LVRARSQPSDLCKRSSTLHILVLSPHRDDAAFSLGLALDGWLAAGHRVTVLGVFTRSLSAPFSDADTVHPNDLLSYVSAMRRREDAELLKLLPGLRMVDLNLKDAVLRLRCAADEAYTVTPAADDTAIAKVQKALGKIDMELKVEAILLPLGLGYHVDHLVVREAALEFASARACAFYEDLPDALRDGEGFVADRNIDAAVAVELANVGDAHAPVTLAVSPGAEAAIRRKRKIVSVYASQVDEATMETISNFASRYGAGERVWSNAAWIADERLIKTARQAP
jgi:LmbE family N-acetylglucosaminyl deacetylase